MLTLSIQDILTKDPFELDPTDEPYCIYLIKDASTILYIGRSKDPLARLSQHFGGSKFFSSGATIGVFYQQYKDLSAHWTLEVYTRAECLGILDNFLQQKGYSDVSQMGADFLECALIEYYHPCVNTRNNPNPSRLPAHYPLGSLIDLDHNAVDVLNF